MIDFLTARERMNEEIADFINKQATAATVATESEFHPMVNLTFINRPNVRSGLVAISPELAESLIAKPAPNRRPSQRIVDKYAASFTAKTIIWQPILIDDRGRVLDGQHRLLAIRAYGKPVTCWVTQGVPSSAWDDLDQGKSRMLGDVLSAMQVKNSSAIAAALTICDMYDRGSFAGNMVSSRDVLLDNYDKRKAEYDSAVEWATSRRGIQAVFGSLSIAAWAAVMLGPLNDALVEFWNIIETGAGAKSATHPALMLRNRLLSGQRAVKFTREAKVAMLIKALNAEWTGSPIGVLRYSAAEGMPKLFCSYGVEV